MKKVHLCIVAFYFLGIACKPVSDEPKPPVDPDPPEEEVIEAFEDDFVVCYPYPEEEKLSSRYRAYVNNRPIAVYNAKVGMENRVDREKAMDDRANSHMYYDLAAFAYFDLKKGAVTVKVSVDHTITRAKILPASTGIVPDIDGKTLSFKVDKPQHLTVEINGEHIRSLHLFVNPEETDVPDPGDPNVVYFGPGIHTLKNSLRVGNGKTVYVAGGAIIRCQEALAEEPHWPTIWLQGSNITLRGRGIIDHESILTVNGREIMRATGTDFKVEGVVFRNASGWNCVLREVKRAHINNIKVLGHRSTSDGIDICDAWDVLVENCFLRTLDDLIVVKTNPGKGGAGRVVAQNCVLWNEVAHAMCIGAEIRENIDDVLFADCDVIGDHGREWTMRVYQCDNTKVSNVRFENIRIEETVRLSNLCIIDNIYTIIPGGYIENVVFKDIAVTNASNTMTDKFKFEGYDAGHTVTNVTVKNVTIAGRNVTAADVVMNNFVSNIKFE